MNSRQLLAMGALSALIAAVACEEDNPLPPAPELPPQIATVTSWSTSNGLPNNDVWDILVTSEGELWIGTQAGIAIYPGITSTSRSNLINELNGLPNPKVRRMIEYNGSIYVATWGGGIGIYNLAADTWAFENLASGMRANNVADLAAQSTEDRVYCATTDGVSIYNPVAGTFTSFVPPNLLDPVVSAVDLRMAGAEVERWYGPRFESVIPPNQENDHGITVSRGASMLIKYTLANSDCSEARVNDIFCDVAPNDVCWVAFTASGLAMVDPAASTWTYHTMRSGLPSNLVYSVTRANDTMWVGTQGGLARQKGGGDWQGYDRGGGLQADSVRRVYSDDGTRLWLGFVGGGAARVDPDSAE